MKKHQSSDLQNNHIIREAIRKIALHGVVSKSTGAVRGTGKVTGYVAKIHMDGDLAGTIDVQEYTQLAVDEKNEQKIGYHEGVFLSALQDNSNGMVIIPKMYSEVVITEDAETGIEYVSMFSHVDVIQLDSHDTITIGVKEREPFDEVDENSPDIEELKDTGIYTKTEYTKNQIITEVQAKKGDADSHVKEILDGTRIRHEIGNNKTIVTAEKDGFHVDHDKTKLDIADKEATLSIGTQKVKVTDEAIYLGKEGSAEYAAVLGQKLCDVLIDLCGYLAQVKTTTQLGPQPFLNMSQFISLRTKIQAAKAGKNDFLTSNIIIKQ